MPTNHYFSQGRLSEQRLYEDLIIEALKIYGQDVYYLPRELVNRDVIFGDDSVSRFENAYKIEMYIENFVGYNPENDTHGTMYFNNTLNDWAKFDINKRTKHDASISSGLAIMACNRHLYAPTTKVEREVVNIGLARFKNSGYSSEIIK